MAKKKPCKTKTPVKKKSCKTQTPVKKRSACKTQTGKVKKKRGCRATKKGQPGYIKRRPNGYILFCMVVRRNMMANDPTVSQKEIAKQAGRCWRKLLDKDRADFISKACDQCERCPTCGRSFPTKKN